MLRSQKNGDDNELENGLDTGISTNTRIRIIPFFSVCAYTCVCARTNENEILFRHNTSTRIFTTRGGCVWPLKTLDLGYLAPKQFSKCRKVRMILFVLNLCLCRVLFSLGSSLLLSCRFVLALVLAILRKKKDGDWYIYP